MTTTMTTLTDAKWDGNLWTRTRARTSTKERRSMTRHAKASDAPPFWAGPAPPVAPLRLVLATTSLPVALYARTIAVIVLQHFAVGAITRAVVDRDRAAIWIWGVVIPGCWWINTGARITLHRHRGVRAVVEGVAYALIAGTATWLGATW